MTQPYILRKKSGTRNFGQFLSVLCSIIPSNSVQAAQPDHLTDNMEGKMPNRISVSTVLSMILSICLLAAGQTQHHYPSTIVQTVIHNCTKHNHATCVHIKDDTSLNGTQTIQHIDSLNPWAIRCQLPNGTWIPNGVNIDPGLQAVRPGDPDFSIVIIPDPQFATWRNGEFTTLPQSDWLTPQLQWIANHRTQDRIAYVSFMGDIVESMEDEKDAQGNVTFPFWRYSPERGWYHRQVDFVREQVRTWLIDNDIPFGYACGNHDIGKSTGETDSFSDLCRNIRRTDGTYWSWFRQNAHFIVVPGTDPDWCLGNRYETFTANGQEFLVAYIQNYWSRKNADGSVTSNSRIILDALDDLREVIAAPENDKKKVIVVHHSLMELNGNFTNRDAGTGMGQDVYDAVKDFPNVFLLLAGHQEDVDLFEATGGAEIKKSFTSPHAMHALASCYHAKFYTPLNETRHVQDPVTGQWVDAPAYWYRYDNGQARMRIMRFYGPPVNKAYIETFVPGYSPYGVTYTCLGNDQIDTTMLSQTTPTIPPVTPTDPVWTNTNYSGTDTFQSVAFGNGRFVAVGKYGSIWFSMNGMNGWEKATSNPVPGNTTLYRVIHDGTRFLAAGISGTVASSIDGTSWELLPTSKNDGSTMPHLFGLAWGNGKYVAVGSGGQIVTSPDGRTWTNEAPTTGVIGNLFGVCQDGNGRFVAVGNNGYLLTSLNGGPWTVAPCPAGGVTKLTSVVFDGTRFVAVGLGGVVMTSPNGLTWNLGPTLKKADGSNADLTDICLTESGKLVAVGLNGIVFVNSGTGWVRENPGTTTALNGITYANRLLVAAGNGTLRSKTQ